MKRHYERFLLCFLVVIWLSHCIQVFVPETGFDAVWYHLPISQAIIENKGLVYLPNLYQSVNPLFADLYFTVGLLVAGELGTKIVAYLFGLSYLFTGYLLAKKYLSKTWLYLFLLVISTFQVVSWQVASFYVDVAKASFELAALYFLYKYLFEGSLVKNNVPQKQKKNLLFSGLFLGASLGSKLFSIFLLPLLLFIVFIFSKVDKLKNTLIYFLSSIIFPLPFYLFAFHYTGDPFYSFFVHLNKLGEIGGNSHLSSYLFERIINFPSSIILLFTNKDYVSFLFLLFLPIMIICHKKLLNRKILFILSFSIFQYLLWWFLPPLSSRYAISGFVTLMIVYFYILEKKSKLNHSFLIPFIISILLSILINLAPRLIANMRSIKYISGQQTKEEYLNQFMDGSIDKNLKEWHFRTTP